MYEPLPPVIKSNGNEENQAMPILFRAKNAMKFDFL